MIYRCILPVWAEKPSKRKVLEGEFDEVTIEKLNREDFYNIYFLPNAPTHYSPGKPVDGSMIDKFEFVFVDCDLKDGKYKTKEAFIETVRKYSALDPSFIVDSGNGVHVYWAVTGLDAMSYLRLQRRLMRLFHTDEAVGQIYQLMRVPNTINTKHKGAFKECTTVYETANTYTAEQMDKLLPKITFEDEEYCKQHHDKTYNLTPPIEVDDKIPLKFAKLLKQSKEVKELWTTPQDDRSAADYRLGHLMFAAGLTKDEAMSVLVNTQKAQERAPMHRVSYAQNIVEKIWTYEIEGEDTALNLSESVEDILKCSPEALKGARFACSPLVDNTHHGFRLGQVIGLVAGSGVGKTAIALNMFRWFVENNPDYIHFFVPLEQSPGEIALRWEIMCGDDKRLHNKVHIMSNYDKEGTFRHLSFTDIKEYLLKFQKVSGKKVGCVVIDHIGALKKKGKNGENQDLMDICHSMKAFAKETNTMLVMQSQAPREKAGIGDLELDKDAAYGTVYFESYCDYLITMWQPLKRCYQNTACPTVTAFKFCKIRHKKQKKDVIQEDSPYLLFFDSESETFRSTTQDEDKSIDYFNKQATTLRKKDRKTDVVEYKSVRWVKKEEENGTANHSQN